MADSFYITLLALGGFLLIGIIAVIYGLFDVHKEEKELQQLKQSKPQCAV